ncbi:MAG: GMC family oxidoreductase [Acidobacteria bacterium]|nr:MAG: GMC family oxidoreductase [Acidobacteriota bacterium]PYQ25003.1 MAG: GMC family oxidoreductase [Acidobacteriota bacterium]
MQVIEPKKVYPVIVIGSGAAGGMAAWNLTRKGVEVLLLDAGDRFDRSKYWTHVRPWEARVRLAKGDHPPQFFLDPKEQPYLTPEGQPFELIRVWGHGGKTNVWGRVSLRYADLDFKSAERDGWEIPWPISYADVAPYYDQVEQLIGVCGGNDDSEVLPGSKYLQPPPRPRCGENLLKRAAAGVGIPMVAGRRANMTRPTRGFPACHYCGKCGSGCDTASFFCSADHLLPFAIQTGKLEVRSNAVVARILVDDHGLARGVQYFHRRTGEEREVHGKVVVLGASCVDSTRILLNSKSERYPNGVGNGSDVIGRYLCEQIRIHVKGFLPELYGMPWQNDRGIGGEHVYMPRFNHRPGFTRDYLRGWGAQFWNTGCNPDGVSHFANGLPGFGVSLKKSIKRHFPAWFEFHPFGEVLPYAHNRITVDESRNDRYGVPLLKIDYRIGDNEKKMADHMYDTLEEIGRAAKAELVVFERGVLDKNGSAIHEHGTCRMGEDPKRSALNRFNQMHEVKNLFVVDGSAFTTASEKNPTLTILALSWRATDYLAEEIGRGNL